MIPNRIKTHLRKVRTVPRAPLIIGAGVLCLLLVAAGSFAAWISWQTSVYEQQIFPNVQVNGTTVSGMTEDEVIQTFDRNSQEYDSVSMQIIYEDQPIATFSGSELDIRTNINDIAKQAYLIGRSDHLPTKVKQQVELFTGLNSYNLETEVQYNTKPLDDLITVTADSYYRPPQDARFLFEDGKVTSFSADVAGLAIDTNQFDTDVRQALAEIANEPADKTIVVQSRPVEPEITLDQTNDLGIEELIGTGQSDYSGSSADRIYNLKLATSKFNGVIIPPGEEFSFNQTIGDISSATGYRSSYIIKNGKTVLGDGGGVCQVSTTAFRAALETGLPITERHAHAYRVSYYENDAKPGFDATIYTPSVDLRFKNDTPSHILIQTEIDESQNLLTFNFYGKSDGRSVEISDAEVWDEMPPPEARYQDDPNLPTGTVKQIEYAAWGAKSNFSYKVTRDGEVITEDEFYSSFRPWGAVYLVGKDG